MIIGYRFTEKEITKQTLRRYENEKTTHKIYSDFTVSRNL